MKKKINLKDKIVKFFHSDKWKHIKKGLDFVVYGYSLILTALLVVGLNIKNNKVDTSNQSRNTSDVNNVQQFDYGYYLHFDVDDTSQGIVLSNAGQYELDAYKNGEFLYTLMLDNFNFPFGFYVGSHDGNFEITDVTTGQTYNKLQFAYNKRTLGSGNLWYYRGIQLIDNHNNVRVIYNENGVACDTSLFHISTFSNLYIYGNNDVHLVRGGIYDIFLDVSYIKHSSNTYDYYFNEQINYNFPYGYSYGVIYLPNSEVITFKNYSLYFECGGLIYKGLRFSYSSTYKGSGQTPTYFITTDGSYVHDESNNQCSYQVMYFIDMDDNQILVNKRDMTTISVNGAPYNAYSITSSWLSDTYRSINILVDDGGTIDYLNGLNDVGVGGVTDYAYGDVFSLLNLGFTGLFELFNISLMPGITIGLLLFTPLVVTIIIAVVKLVKK